MPTEATATALSPAQPVIKLRRRRRAVPKVRVYSRHRPACRWFKKGDDRTGCPCPKQLLYYRDGKLYREHGEKIKVGSHGFGRHSFVLMCLNGDMPVHDIG